MNFMGKIKGITIELITEKNTGREDGLGRPITEEITEKVENVLVMPASADDTAEKLDLNGKKAIYLLGIPKNDTHDWTGAKVRFFDKTWDTVGIVQELLEHITPLDWNKKIAVTYHGRSGGEG